ncbi:MAG: beta strand repeat-containing protein [Thermoguttaceae bacterium]
MNLVGTLDVDDFTLPGGWGLTGCTLSFDTGSGNYTGAATLVIPDAFNLGVTFGLVCGRLNRLGVSLSNLGDTVPLGDTGWFLDGAGGSVSNLAPGSGPITFTGTLDFTLGPDETINLPGWLGLGSTIHTDLADLDLTASISTQALSGIGNLTVAGGLATATAKANYDFGSGNFTASASLSVLDGIFTGDTNLVANHGGAVLSGTGQVSLPLSNIESWLPDPTLASGSFLLNLVPSDLSGSYLDVWGSIWGLGTCGASINLGSGSVNLLNAQTVPKIDPPASATFSVAPATPWVLLDAQWTVASSNVPFEIQTPDGSLYTAANLPGNVSVVQQATSSTEVTLQVASPTAGNWSLILPDADPLGTVTFASVGGTVASNVQLAFLQATASAIAGGAVDPVAIVAIEDQNGDVISTDNSQVTLTLTGGPGNTNTVLTNQALNGIATFDGVAPQRAGSYTLQATDGTDIAASGAFTVAPAAVSSVTFVQQPTNVVAGKAIAPAIVVQTQDQYGNAISGDTVTLAVENYPSGTVYSTYLATTDTSGNATFANISLPVAGTYTLAATDGAISSGSSSSFTVFPASASMLVFAQQPSNAPAGTAISPDVVVDVEDQFGNLITTDNSTVVLSLKGDGILNGTPIVQAQDGVATFGGLSLNGSGVYTIGAGDGFISATSTPFTISKAEPTLTLSSPPPSITYDGTGDVTNWAIPSVSSVLDMPNPTGLPNVVFYSGISSAGTPLASAPVNAGTYTAIASYSGDANYTAQSTPVTFSIGQAMPTVTAHNANTTYTGSLQAYPGSDVTVAGANGLSKSDGSLSYTYNGSATVPTTSGSYAVLVTFTPTDATDYAIATGTATWNIIGAPAITSAAGTTFRVGSADRFTVTTTGYPVAAITESGKLPGGITFVDNHDGMATLSGTPTGTGVYTLTINAANGVLPATAPQTFTLTVDQMPTITSAASTTFTVGTSGSFTIKTTPGFPTTTTLSENGDLPSGVNFVDNHNGTATLSGKPAAASGGPYSLTINASNGVSPAATQKFTLSVNQAPSITSFASTAFAVGNPGSFTIRTTPGFPTTTTLKESGNLPSGVKFVDNHNGTATLSGTPAAGTGRTYSWTITAGNGVSSVTTQAFTLTVDQAPAITSAANATFKVGQAGSFSIKTTGYPVAAFAEIGSLPGGVTLIDQGNGTAILSGTPTTGSGKVYTFTVSANNGVAPATTQTFNLTVDQAPAITSPNNATFTVAQKGTFTVATTGFPAATLKESGNLPGGVTFVDNHDGTATLSGTPAAGTGRTYSLTISASNGVLPAVAQTFTLMVDAKSSSNTINGQPITSSPPTVTVTTAASPTAAPSLGEATANSSAIDAALRALLLDESSVTGKPRSPFES